MSDSKRANRVDAPTCPRCRAAQMKEIVAIAPVADDPRGLIAYECPNCSYVTSVVYPSHGAFEA